MNELIMIHLLLNRASLHFILCLNLGSFPHLNEVKRQFFYLIKQIPNQVPIKKKHNRNHLKRLIVRAIFESFTFKHLPNLPITLKTKVLDRLNPYHFDSLAS